MELLHSVAGFFHDEVKDALRVRHVEATETTEFYLVNLLCEFTTAAPDGQPLGLKLAEAQNASPETRVRTLKEVGDTSLYMSGFFAEALARRLVDVSYYMTLGGSAYHQLACMTSGSAVHEAFEELAVKFGAFVDVLDAIRTRQHMGGGTANVLKLYEEWRRTGSEVLEKRLRAAGVLALDAVNTNEKS